MNASHTHPISSPCRSLIGVGLFPRLIAFLGDLLIALGFAWCVLSIFGSGKYMALVCSFTLWSYFALLESSSWQATLGKKLLGLKVVDKNGERIDLAMATGRHFSRKIAYCLLGGLGTLGVLVSPRKLALHDWSSGTFVVWNR